MKKIKYIVIGAKKEKIKKETLESLESLVDKPETQISFIQVSEKDKEEDLINKEVSELGEDIQYVCIIKNNTIFKETSAKTIKEYIKDSNTVYLPLIEYHGIIENAAGFKGFLNSSLWKPYFAENIGQLDLKLSKRGIDLTIYGAFIPVNILKSNKLKSKISYYSHFEWLNRIIHKEIPVVGIPRTTIKTTFDYELQSVPKEKKIEFFKLAQEDYVNEA